MDTLWKQVLDEIQLEVSKTTYSLFFKKTQLVSFENNIATIHAPTFMVAGELEKRYSNLIKKILDKKSGQETNILFTASPITRTFKNAEEGPLFKAIIAQKNRPAKIKQTYRFESIAVSDSNQLAFTAAQTVSENLGKKYNPLFMYGSVGVGKTHLMHAIANRVIEKNPDMKIFYLTTEEFTNEVVEAIRDRSMQNIRKKFRHANLLLLDDVQFLAGKEKVQEELFHTFNALVDNGGQIVFSSDRPPSEIKKIESRLASRFSGGLTVDIEKPDFELRTAILLIKSRSLHVPLSTESAKIIAEKIEDTRALEGFLLKLLSFLSFNKKQEASPEEILLLLGKGEKRKKTLHPDTIIDAVCSYYNIKPTQLKGSKRDFIFVRPRHVCMFLLKEEARLTLFEIGNLLGGKDHTTVMHGVDKIKSLLSDPEGRVAEDLASIKERLSRGGFQ